MTVPGEVGRWRRRLAISALTAVLLPAAFGGLLAGANAIADRGDDTTWLVHDTARPPPPPQHPHHSLSTLGRARAVAWISAGHTGR